MTHIDGPGTERDHSWHTLAEFSLPSIEGNERKAMELVAQAVAGLQIEGERLECLKTAVAEATMNATEHGNLYQNDLPVSIKVLAADGTMAVQITDYGLSGPIPAPVEPDVEAKLAGKQPTRGWGFFLIQKMVDVVQIESDNAHHTIQLFVYLEGANGRAID